ncbi:MULTISPECIES: cytidine deaminase [Zhenhengia]|uniref:Cytidine deaminase n=1 Tax=Zhenhengia yiwuensis TaxID=2763666 RepID=A0A926IE30_9FIRM|nr:cytidine deaminase [Zhenhengia yiwuensis]MBP3912710.1 cytidine deaminase [Niameybacter sp.]MDU6361078.1 cytidine deaminase [Clostridiales bacterium]MDU7538122.1 cytidine deaminase [Peptostreptococcaceae bacterium]MBC8579323.1 cytidine deaminase [Zhenhengia yiwuensis]MDY3367639.1 cytidine deaminase [Zhenhengia yiwuensis]
MEEYKQLVEKAKEAMTYAYAPYSNFKVGAALLTDTDKIYTGCNVENASFGATNCAERTAIFKAVSEGELRYKAIAIVSSSKEFTYPCGICRQVIGEFMPNGHIILENALGEIKVFEFKELLPGHFTQEDLNK